MMLAKAVIVNGRRNITGHGGGSHFLYETGFQVRWRCNKF